MRLLSFVAGSQFNDVLFLREATASLLSIGRMQTGVSNAMSTSAHEDHRVSSTESTVSSLLPHAVSPEGRRHHLSEGSTSATSATEAVSALHRQAHSRNATSATDGADLVALPTDRRSLSDKLNRPKASETTRSTEISGEPIEPLAPSRKLSTRTKLAPLFFIIKYFFYF